ncbi:hypothetical protein [Staphylospora marina]|uniref:hypothetical protein n=1 Tax=Staphylospora marina TaxID=2490858 RepID=UPI0013DDFE0D|nr:hypothetical protein [Staphylospora marina]
MIEKLLVFVLFFLIVIVILLNTSEKYRPSGGLPPFMQELVKLGFRIRNPWIVLPYFLIFALYLMVFFSES